MAEFTIDSFLSDNDVWNDRIDKSELPVIEPADTWGETVNDLLNRIVSNFRTGTEGKEDNRALNANIEYVFDVIEQAHDQVGMFNFLTTVAGKLKSLNMKSYAKLTPKSYKGVSLDSIVESFDMETGFRFANHPLSLFSALQTNKDTIIEAIK